MGTIKPPQEEYRTQVRMDKTYIMFRSWTHWPGAEELLESESLREGNMDAFGPDILFGSYLITFLAYLKSLGQYDERPRWTGRE